MVLGHLRIGNYLKAVDGLVTGGVVSDAKDRQYRQRYEVIEQGDRLIVKRADGYGDTITLPKNIELDEALVSFFGLYSGDGAKGSEDKNDPKRIVPTISFSQREKHLVRFAVDQFLKLFGSGIRFTFSLGEDSAFFMDKKGKQDLEAHYKRTTGSATPAPKSLKAVRPQLNAKDEQYLKEVRPDVSGPNEQHLAFYYQHKKAMQAILADAKSSELSTVGLRPASNISTTASLRRPFKKGARLPGGSSRSDEIHVGGLTGLGELFLKMLHEVEDSILRDSKLSSSGLVEWTETPSRVGQDLDLLDFFSSNPYGQIDKSRPKQLTKKGETITGQWPRSTLTTIRGTLKIDPLWCYVAGLYLAEGTTPKTAFFSMFGDRPKGLALGFTSSEGTSLELMLRTLRKLFLKEDCLRAWKIKVGSQYFPELVVTGLKNGLPMLRGGESGDGKLRTMEISLAVKEWALQVADLPLHGRPSLLAADYADRYSHVEPTGAGVARIDFWTSSALSRWYFPLLMYAVFAESESDPVSGFFR